MDYLKHSYEGHVQEDTVRNTVADMIMDKIEERLYEDASTQEVIDLAMVMYGKTCELNDREKLEVQELIKLCEEEIEGV